MFRLKSVDQSPLLPQRPELLADLVERNHHALFLGSRVITVADVNRAALLFGSTNNEDEVILLKLSSTDLLLHGVAAEVDVHIQLIAAENRLQLLDVVVDSRHDGHNQNLTRADPERPLATEVLNQNSKETLETADDSTVDDNRAGTARTRLVGLGLTLLSGISRSLLIAHVLKLEVDRSLVIELDSRALELSLEGVSDGNIDLRPVEGTITLIDGPVIALELGHGRLELLLCVVPGLELTQVLLGPGGELQLEGETEQAIDSLQEVEQTLDFRSDLVLSTENVSVILLELADTGETAQGSGRLISVQDTKVRDSQGKLSVTSLTVAEEHKVTGAVHRLESPLPPLKQTIFLPAINMRYSQPLLAISGIIASAASTTTSFPANFTLISTLDNSVLTTDGWGIYDSTTGTTLTLSPYRDGTIGYGPYGQALAVLADQTSVAWIIQLQAEPEADDTVTGWGVSDDGFLVLNGEQLWAFNESAAEPRRLYWVGDGNEQGLVSTQLFVQSAV